MRKNMRKKEVIRRRFFCSVFIFLILIFATLVIAQLPNGFHLSFDSDEIFNVTIYKLSEDSQIKETEVFNENYDNLKDFEADIYNCTNIRVVIKFKDNTILYNKIIKSSTDAFDNIIIKDSDLNFIFDVDGDGKIGLEEVIYSLQIISQTIRY